jgi:hypothetical protein
MSRDRRSSASTTTTSNKRCRAASINCITGGYARPPIVVSAILSRQPRQSQRLGSGTSRAFFGVSARSIAFLASTIAIDLLCALPVIATFATDADHFHKSARCLEQPNIRCRDIPFCPRRWFSCAYRLRSRLSLNIVV